MVVLRVDLLGGRVESLVTGVALGGPDGRLGRILAPVPLEGTGGLLTGLAHLVVTRDRPLVVRLERLRELGVAGELGDLLLDVVGEHVGPLLEA